MSLRVRGQGESYRRLVRRARSLELHHGVLIEGPRGVGKSEVARELARSLLCEAGSAYEPCGECNVCSRVDTDAHPDLHIAAPLEDKQEISIDQVRALQVVLGRRAVEGRARVAILDPADRVTEQAQNALLKTLEEPGAATFVLLPATRPERLLATVRSRVARLRVQRLAHDAIARALAEEKVAPREARWAAGLCGGSLGLARELVAAGIEDVHQQLVVFLSRPNEMSAVHLARQVLTGAVGRPAVDHRARIVLLVLRAVLRDSMRAQLVNLEAGPYVADAFEPWNSSCESLLRAEVDLDLRIAPEQALVDAILSLQQALTGVAR